MSAISHINLFMEPRDKEILFEGICTDPLAVSREQAIFWASHEDPDKAITFDDLRRLMLRIFDQNEKSLLEASDATTGGMGWANRVSTNSRQKKFNRLINDGFRQGNNKIIVAEGDSWFQFPFFIKDIVDHLGARKDCAVYSMAYGGDWLTNIIFEGKYVEDISLISPDVFLISGGGNDLVGASRIAVMVDKEPCYRAKYITEEDIETQNKYAHKGNLSLLQPYNAEKILLAQKYIKKEFYSFRWVLFIQFYLIFKSFQRSSKLKNMLVLCQGYDYAIPHKGFRFDIRYPHQPFVNFITGSSKWLFTPLMLKGIRNATDQEAIIHAFIFEFNMMFMELAQDSDFPNVVHVDCRGVAKNHNDWFDELHLKSHVFERIGKVMHRCIQSYGQPGNSPAIDFSMNKIIRVTDHLG